MCPVAVLNFYIVSLCCYGTVPCFISGELVVVLILHLANLPMHVEG